MALKKTFNNNFLVELMHMPVRKGLIYIPNAERRKLPYGKVVMTPEGYEGEVVVGEIYLYDNQKTFRVDDNHVLMVEDSMLARLSKGVEVELDVSVS